MWRLHEMTLIQNILCFWILRPQHPSFDQILLSFPVVMRPFSFSNDLLTHEMSGHVMGDDEMILRWVVKVQEMAVFGHAVH